jgi:ATP-binding cassette subfamily B protein
MTSSENWISVSDETTYFWKDEYFEYQDTQYDCAHSCLSMMTSIFGKNIPKNWFRAHFPPHLGGVSILELKKMTQEIHIDSEAFQCEWEDLRDLQTPLILYFENHFVLLAKRKNGKLVLANPAIGISDYDEKFPPSEWSGIGLLSTVTEYFFQPTTPSPERKLGYRNFIKNIPFPVILFLLSILPTLLYWFEGQLFHKIGTQLFGHSAVDGHAGKLFLVLIVLEVAKELTGFISLISLLKSSAYFDLKSGLTFLENLLRMGFIRYQGFKFGDIDLIFDELGILRKFLIGSSLKLFGALVMTIVLGASVWSQNPMLFIIPLLATIIAFIVLLPLRNKSLSYNQMEFVTREQFSTVSRNYFSVFDLISRFRLRRRAIHEISKYFDKNLLTNINIKKNESLIIFVSGTIRVISELAILISLLISHLNGSLSAADLILGYWLSSGILGSLITIVTLIINYARLKLTFSRLGLIIRPLGENNVEILKESNSILPLCFSNLCFSYIQSNELLALNNLNLTIERPGVYGIFGKSGSGKSTLGLIFSGLQKSLSGTISSNNTEITDQELLVSVSYVFQDEGLFEKTLEENISLSEGDFSAEKMEKAKFVSTLEDIAEKTLITNIKDLSEGQKQRILLARSLYRDRKLIVLDEGTHSLDSQSEKLFINRFKSIFPDRVLIIISHRKTTMSLCDKIFVLNKGEIIDEGIPSELSLEFLSSQHGVE